MSGTSKRVFTNLGFKKVFSVRKQLTGEMGPVYVDAQGYPTFELYRFDSTYRPNFLDVAYFYSGTYATGGANTTIQGTNYFSYRSRWATSNKGGANSTSVRTSFLYCQSEIPQYLKDKGYDVITAVKPISQIPFSSTFIFANYSRFFAFVNRSSGTFNANLLSAQKYDDTCQFANYGEWIILENMKTAVTKDKIAVIPNLFTPQMNESAYTKQDYSDGRGNEYYWIKNLDFIPYSEVIIRCEKSSVLNITKGDTW